MVIHDTLRGVLSVRNPDADFTPYFAFIESRPARNRTDSECHHVLPEAEFPEQAKNSDNHVNRNITNPNCGLCRGGINAV